MTELNNYYEQYQKMDVQNFKKWLYDEEKLPLSKIGEVISNLRKYTDIEFNKNIANIEPPYELICFKKYADIENIQNIQVSLSEITSENVYSNSCPQCGNTDYLLEGDEYVCKMCGLVVGNTSLDFSREWRAYSAEDYEKKCRSGGKSTHLLHDNGKFTKIGSGSRDGSGAKLSVKSKNRHYNLIKVDNRYKVNGDGERNFIYALREIKRLGVLLSLPESMIEECGMLYKKYIYSQKVTRGKSIDNLILGLIYLVCRQNNIPRSFGELERLTKISRSNISTNAKYLKKLMGMDLKKVDPILYIPRYVSIIGLPEKEIGGSVEKMYNACKRNNQLTSGRNPIILLITLIYINAKLQNYAHITQQKLHKDFKVTTTTIRNRLQHIDKLYFLRITHEQIDYDLSMKNTIKFIEEYSTSIDLLSKIKETNPNNYANITEYQNNLKVSQYKQNAIGKQLKIDSEIVPAIYELVISGKYDIIQKPKLKK